MSKRVEIIIDLIEPEYWVLATLTLPHFVEEDTMKRVWLIPVVALLVLSVPLSGCAQTAAVPAGGITSAPAEPSAKEPHEDDAPLEFSSLEELSQAVSDTKANTVTALTEDLQPQMDEYEIDALEFYYIPTWLPSDASLYAVRVKDNYVALYYILGEQKEDAAPSGEPLGYDKLTSTAMFEWTRTEDGAARLENLAEQTELSLLTEETLSASDVYYSDITWYEQPDDVIGRQYYWVQDGYMFSLYTPTAEIDADMKLDVVQVPVG